MYVNEGSHSFTCFIHTWNELSCLYCPAAGKVVITGESHKGVQNTGRWPCGVCGRMSLQCINCQKWVHKCSDIKVSTIKACWGCIDHPAGSAGLAGVCLKLVDKFFSLGDMLGTDGDTSAALKGRVQKGWYLGNWRLCLPIMMFQFLWKGGDREILCEVVHGSKTWPVKRIEWHFCRLNCGLSWRWLDVRVVLK